MKVLIVNYYGAPMTGAHAYRWSQLAKHWSQQGWEVDYICSRQHSKEDATDKLLYNDIRVGFSLAKRRGGVGKESSGSIRSRLLLALKKVYRSVFWPDGLWHWMPYACFAIWKNRKHKYDLIVSYSPTYSSHLAVLLFKKLSKREFTWIADYGDPFSLSNSMPPNNFKLYRGLNRLAERSIIRNCSSIVFTNKETKLTYDDSYSCKDKSHHIPHLVDLEEFYSSLAEESSSTDLVLVYVGGFHRGIREPCLALDIIERLIRILKDKGVTLQVDFYGPVNGVKVRSVDGVLWHGEVDRRRAIEIMKRADILLNIENVNCIMTPSKIVEYVATGKPIVNIVEQNKTELLDKYEKIGGCCSVFKVECLDSLVEFIGRARGKSLSSSTVSELLRDYRLGNVAHKFELICNQRSSC